jgi:hypothetical protein
VAAGEDGESVTLQAERPKMETFVTAAEELPKADGSKRETAASS